jgi:hypothetical protein
LDQRRSRKTPPSSTGRPQAGGFALSQWFNPAERYHTSYLLGPSWGSYTGDKISGMDKWYSHIGTVSGGAGSSYEATVNEYTDKAGERVSSSVTYGGHIVDATALPKNITSSAVLAEVCK